jgi:division protein CdvB (Snf7/Vps24/ESCRT-III family)
LQSLAQQGLIVPDDLDPEDEKIPLDFTVAPSRAIGAIHSRFAVRHAHGIYVIARTRNRLTALRRQLRIEQARYRTLNRDKFQKKYQLDDAMKNSKRVSRLERQIEKSEIQLEVQEAVVEGFLDVVRAASREMSRRESERAPRD